MDTSIPGGVPLFSARNPCRLGGDGLVLPVTSEPPRNHFRRWSPPEQAAAMPRQAPLIKWVFTLNNPTEQDKKDVLALDYQYLVFQLERGDSGA